MKRNVFYFILGCLLWFGCQPTPTNTVFQEKPETAFEDPPAWAREAIWYQIFVERFRNGDPDNDPTPPDIIGAYPGYVPQGWSITPWTQDWYAPDPYFARLTDLENFNQKVQLRRYGGDLQGVLDKIDYLDSLGVNAIYFNPLNDAPSLHKFDARHWRHVDRNFGPDPQGDRQIIAQEMANNPDTWQWTSADTLFLHLIDQLHQRDIKVIVDFSWNHTGVTFWAWQDILAKQESSPYAGWYYIEAFDDPATPENEFDYRGWANATTLPEIRETIRPDHTKVTPFEGTVADPAAKAHIFAVTRRWLDPNGDGDPTDGIDGYRLDVAGEMPLGFWREFREVVRETNPEAYLVGEIWWELFPNDFLDPAPYLEGDIFDAVMNYRWYRTARHFLNEAPGPMPVTSFVQQLQALHADLRPANIYAMMNVTSTHDTPRLSTSLFNKNLYKYQSDPGQNPDYKIHRPDSVAYRTLRLLLTHQFTYLGAPHIWAGDEMGMWGADDPSCRKPLIWPDYTFQPERAHPLGLDRPIDSVAFDQTLFRDYQTLIGMRKKYTALSNGALSFVVQNEPAKTLAYRRFNEQEDLLTVLNANDTPQTVRLSGDYELIWQVGTMQLEANAILMSPRSAAVLVKH